MTDLVFLDTETMGLDPAAPVWEFAAIRVFANGNEDRTEFFIRHDPQPWINDFPAPFSDDYIGRYRAVDALDEHNAAVMIHMVTRGAHIVGAVPSFDTERLAALLRRNGIEPEWHYHLIDVENVIVGYLVGVGKQAVNDGVLDTIDLGRVAPPWKSDTLSAAVGVEPTKYKRHTAMGDVLWVKAQWESVMAGPAPVEMVDVAAISRDDRPSLAAAARMMRDGR